MKKMKKMASFLLAMLMALALAIPAMAAGSEYPTTNGQYDPAKAQYEVYQIFTGDYNAEAEGEVLSNIKWGQNGTGNVGETVDKTVLDALTAVANETSNSAKLDVIMQYADIENGAMMTGEVGQKEFTVAPGYYLVKDVEGSQTGNNAAYSFYVVEVTDGKLVINPKVSGVPTPDKKIIDDGKELEENEASIGDTVTYKLTATMPADIDQYKTYYLVFTDRLSKGLDYDAITSIKVNEVDVTNYFYVGSTKNEETGETTLKIGIEDLKALSLLTTPAVGDITTATVVEVIYTAILNDEAVIAGDGNPNYVKLTYSNSPSDSGDGAKNPPPPGPDEPKPTTPVGETPEIDVVTYTTKLTVIKVDGSGKILDGATFTLSGTGVNKVVVTTETTFEPDENGQFWKLKDGTYTTTAPVTEDTDDVKNNVELYDDINAKYKLVNSTKETLDKDADSSVTKEADGGAVTFEGLGVGDYVLKETVTPDGYNTAADIEFTITYEDGKFVSSNPAVVIGEGTNVLETTVVNNKGATLPETGGIGTTIFYVVGGALVIGAVVLLVTKKRMSNIEE